jgi:hypothetical protein
MPESVKIVDILAKRKSPEVAKEFLTRSPMLPGEEGIRATKKFDGAALCR